MNWADALEDVVFKRRFVINFLLCLIIYFTIIHWLQLNSSQSGMVVFDPIHALLPVRDFSLLIFILTYSATLSFIVYVVQYPTMLHRAFTAFTAVFVVRALCIHFLPLCPPAGMIVLNDPILNNLADEQHILNDLFFSGHIADLSIFYFIAMDKRLKRFIFCCGVVVAFLLVWQRVHYTFDVLAAPAFSYLSYWLFVEKDIIWASIKKPIFQ